MVVLIAAMLIAGTAWFRHPNPTGQFFEAFSTQPASTVKYLRAYRRYVGGPGDTVVLLRFNADRSAVAQALSGRIFERDVTIVDNWFVRNQDLDRLWYGLFATYYEYGGRDWTVPEKLFAPEVYRWNGMTSPIVKITFLWDSNSGEAYVVMTKG